MNTLNFYILNGKNKTLAQNKILWTPKCQFVHSKYHFCNAHFIHKHVPQGIVLKLWKYQNISNNEFTNIPLIDQVIKQREELVYSNRNLHQGKGYAISEDWQI